MLVTWLIIFLVHSFMKPNWKSDPTTIMCYECKRNVCKLTPHSSQELRESCNSQQPIIKIANEILTGTRTASSTLLTAQLESPRPRRGTSSIATHAHTPVEGLSANRALFGLLGTRSLQYYRTPYFTKCDSVLESERHNSTIADNCMTSTI